MNRKLKDAKYCSSANFKRKAEAENVDEKGQNKEEIIKKKNENCLHIFVSYFLYNIKKLTFFFYIFLFTKISSGHIPLCYMLFLCS